MTLDDIMDAMGNVGCHTFLFPDGSRARIARTCCSAEHPDNRGPHGQHFGGHNPLWMDDADGEWQNVRYRGGEFRFLMDAFTYGLAALNATEWREAMLERT